MLSGCKDVLLKVNNVCMRNLTLTVFALICTLKVQLIEYDVQKEKVFLCSRKHSVSTGALSIWALSAWYVQLCLCLTPILKWEIEEKAWSINIFQSTGHNCNLKTRPPNNKSKKIQHESLQQISACWKLSTNK